MIVRKIIRGLYTGWVGMKSLLVRPNMSTVPCISYGGARGGHRGGPQVKVELLRSIFPEGKVGFNVLYLLSGALYMPSWALRILKKRGVPIVLNQNGVFYPAWSPQEWQEGNARMARALALADHVFYQSEFCKKCADKFLGLPKGSWDILYNGVDTKFFVPHTDKKPNERFQFLVTGNIGPSTYYRLTNALEALVLARADGFDVEIHFAGFIPDDLLHQFVASIAQKNMQKFFCLRGPYERHNAPHLFASADAYLITKHNDPCPNVVLEAMACGLPILYSASGGVPELVGNEAGVGLPVPDTFEDNPVPEPSAIVAGMKKIIDGHTAMSAAARDRAVTIFDIDLWAVAHRKVFENLLARKR